MKPCSRNRKRIAWLALNELAAQDAAMLREHLAVCDGCRRYWEEVSNVTAGLTSRAPDSDLEASESFYRRLAGRLRAPEPGSALERLAARVRGTVPRWRVALPAAVLLVAALVVVVALRRPAAVSPPAPFLTDQAPAPAPAVDLAPTVANYQIVAGQSLEKLSELLTRQGNRELPPVPDLDPFSPGGATR